MTRAGSLLLMAAVALALLGVLLLRRRASDPYSELGNSRSRLGASGTDYLTGEADLAETTDLLGANRIKGFKPGSEVKRKTERGLSLQSRLRYANLGAYPPYVFSIIQIAISLSAFLIARMYVKEVLQIISLSTGPLLVNWYINRRIENRVREFDLDFPQFLLSVVGMLKTGLNTMQALQAAADGLEPTSAVRQEVELMLERFRVGVSEDRSIGSFAEDVLHPEVELFVQALILSRRVGGTLSETLDRLAKQVRKRQNFKMAAKSAIGMHRGSIWAILCLILGLQLYMYRAAPEMVIGTWINPSLTGWAQASIALMLVGVRWMNSMTKFKV
jgi:tight adherence protein B